MILRDLPDGMDQKDYVRKEKEWPGLERRLGQPRILQHVYFKKILDWIQQEHKDSLDDFSYFEAGCGHGNDLRVVKDILNGRGHFLGVDMSTAEIIHGIEFYQKERREDPEESRKLFAQGNLCNLEHINTWNEEKNDFSRPAKIQDGKIDLIYMEAVLHGLGYGKRTYQEKKDTAQKMFNELSRVCKVEGRFFGRASTFGPDIAKEQQFELLRKTNNWRFIPEAKEFEEMLKQAGFGNIEITLIKHEKAEEDPNKENIFKASFLAHA